MRSELAVVQNTTRSTGQSSPSCKQCHQGSAVTAKGSGLSTKKAPPGARRGTAAAQGARGGARKATAGGGAGALVAKFRRRVATFDKNRDFEHLDDAARGILLAAEASAAAGALKPAAPEAAAALTVAPAATGQLGWACDAVSRRLPTVVAIRAVAENENAATMSEH